MPQIPVAIAILQHQDQFLLQLRDNIPTIVYPGVWGLFGGHLEAGETPEVTIQRELREEIGYCPPRLQLWGRYGDSQVLRYVFYGRLEVGLAALCLREGWDMQLCAVEDIRRGDRYSSQSGDRRPIALPHQTILLDFLSRHPDG